MLPTTNTQSAASLESLERAASEASRPSTLPLSPNATASPVQPCPLQGPWFAIEVEVVDEDFQPVGDVLIEVSPGSARALTDRTSSAGRVRFEGLLMQSHSLRVPALDQEAWELIEDVPLPADQATVPESAAWGSPISPEEPAPPHEVTSGECASSLGFQYGFFPETLWNHSENSALRDLRKDKNILFPGDIVHIPRKRQRVLNVTPARRYRLRRRGIPEILRIVFEDDRQRPRKLVPYLITMTTFNGEIVRSRKGFSDSSGLVREPIPPDADQGEILFGIGPDQERLPFTLGRVSPISTLEGVHTRLTNLGYTCGPFCGKVTDWMKIALDAFQFDHGLERSCEIDDPTRQKLQELHRS